MRYEEIDSVVFTTKDDISVTIKDMREYPSYQTLLQMTITEEDQIDEIATRRDIYGDDAEGEAFKITDHNIIKLFENDFDLDKLKSLKVPI